MPPKPASPEPSPPEASGHRPRDETLHRVAVCVLAYEASSTIEEVLDRIPHFDDSLDVTVLVADDASTDATPTVARRWVERHRRDDVEVIAHPENLGYGGNQIACMDWAARRDMGVVAMLHGDAQYPPEALEDLVAPVCRGDADAVFGSRMITPGSARAGGMPWGRLVGNRVLSSVQNGLSGARLSEWHSGLRAYRVGALAAIEPETLPRGFEVDTVATLRLVGAGATIEEIAIPTRYAGETSRIRPVRDGIRILVETLRHARRPVPAIDRVGP